MINLAHKKAKDTYYNRVKTCILPMIPAGQHTILDVGCGAGQTGRRLLELGKAETLIGVEIFEPAASEAARSYKKLHIGDIESLNLPYRATFDYVIFGDVLEHLKNPYLILKQSRAWLRPGGYVIACVPNIRKFPILIDLVFRGEWRYRESGIMDQTHLRFFTRRSALRMVLEAGYKISHSSLLIYGLKKNWLNRLSLGLLGEFLATQILIMAHNTKDADVTVTDPKADNK